MLLLLFVVVVANIKENQNRAKQDSSKLKVSCMQ